MDVHHAIEKRRSIRKYRKDPVPEETLGRLLEAARLAPSASNTQSWKFKVVTDRAEREALKKAAFGQKFVGEAPVVIACCIDWEAYGESARRGLELILKGAVRPNIEMILRYAKRHSPTEEFDSERAVINGVINVSIATEHIALAAVEMGLGTCWVRAFDVAEAERVLDLPEGVSVLCLLTVGYPAQDPPMRPRKTLDDITL